MQKTRKTFIKNTQFPDFNKCHIHYTLITVMQIGLSRIKTSVGLNRQHFFYITKAKYNLERRRQCTVKTGRVTCHW